MHLRAISGTTISMRRQLDHPQRIVMRLPQSVAPQKLPKLATRTLSTIRASGRRMTAPTGVPLELP